MTNPYEKRLLRVLDYIHDNPAGDLSLDALADVAAMSRFHWHRVYHAMTGETCAQAVRRVRMQRAAGWLAYDGLPVAKVAARVGYPNIQSFSRAFKAETGISPGAFRKRGEISSPRLEIRKGTTEMYDVEIRQTPDCRLVGLAHTGAYTRMGRAFEKLAAIAGTRNLWPSIKGAMAVYYDDPTETAEDELRSFAGLLVSDDLPLPEGLKEVQVIGGTTAVLRFKGPYAELGKPYAYLFGEWLPNSGHEPRDQPLCEVYVNSPFDTKQAELIVDICLPLV
jgi:AraC family transcriptional regulator